MLGILETITRYYRIERREISFLRFILEAYDGLAVLTTVDPETGVVNLQIAPGCEADVELILQELKNNIIIEELDGNQKNIHSYHRMSDERL